MIGGLSKFTRDVLGPFCTHRAVSAGLDGEGRSGRSRRSRQEQDEQDEQEQQQQQQQEQEGESMLADAQYTAHGHSPPYAAFNSPRPAFETSTPCAGRRGAQL